MVISIVGVVLTAIGVLLVYLQLRKNHKWNRRQAAHDLLFGPYMFEFYPQYEHIRSKVDMFDSNKDYTDYEDELSEEDKLKIDQTLNFLENVCISMRDNIVDEEVVYKSVGSLLPNYQRFMNPYIKEQRSEVSSLLWVYLDDYAERWRKRAEKRKKSSLDGRREEGRDKL